MRKTGLLGTILLLCALATAKPMKAAAADEISTTPAVAETLETEERSYPDGNKDEIPSSAAIFETVPESEITDPKENTDLTEAIDPEETLDPEETVDPAEVFNPEEDIDLKEEIDPTETPDLQADLSPDSEAPAPDAEEPAPDSEDSNPDTEAPLPDSEDPASVSEDPTSGDITAESGAEVVTSGTADAAAGRESKEKTADRIHFITLNGEHFASNAFLIESNGLYGLIDASNPSGEADDKFDFKDLGANGLTVVSYLTDLDVDHLTFVLSTHNHTDHIGGMTDIAASGLVDSGTVYIYKEYEVKGEKALHNDHYADLATEAMKATGAAFLNLLDPDSKVLQSLGAQIVYDKTDRIGDHVVFTMGDFLIKLFNIHTESYVNENINSVVTTVEKDGSRAVLMADMEMTDYAESRTVEAIMRDDAATRTELLQLGHHGYYSATSLDTIQTLNPANYLASTHRVGQEPEEYTIFNYFIEKAGGKMYRTSENDPAIIADFGKKGISLLRTAEDGTETAATAWNAVITDGWHRWYPDEESYLSSGGMKWIYISSGSAVKGWFKLEDGWHYADDRYAVSAGWSNIDDRWYYMGSYGLMQTGWRQIKGDWYYFKSNGIMQTGWADLNGKWYYLKGDGVMYTGWLKDNGKWYYLSSNGVMQTGWLKDGGNWYYLDSKGAMQTGWIKPNENWYYLKGDGVMYTGWLKDSGNWYYLNSKGAMQTGWLKDGGNWYYFNSKGVMQTSWLKDGANWYYLNSNGVMQTGWLKDGGNWYYFNSKGVMHTGWLRYNGKWYYLSRGGAVQTGWINAGGKWYYLDSSGAMVCDKWIGSYYLKPNGEMAVDEWIGTYYVGKDGKWDPSAKKEPSVESEAEDSAS